MNYDKTQQQLGDSLGIKPIRQDELMTVLEKAFDSVGLTFSVDAINEQMIPHCKTMEEAFFVGQAIPIILSANYTLIGKKGG